MSKSYKLQDLTRAGWGLRKRNRKARRQAEREARAAIKAAKERVR